MTTKTINTERVTPEMVDIFKQAVQDARNNKIFSINDVIEKILDSAPHIIGNCVDESKPLGEIQSVRYEKGMRVTINWFDIPKIGFIYATPVIPDIKRR